MSIQLNKEAAKEVSAVINKIFSTTPEGRRITTIISDSGGRNAMTIRDVYPSQQGSDVPTVTDLVKNMYAIYKSMILLLNSAGNTVEGVLQNDDPDLQRLVTGLRTKLQNEENRGVSVELLPENKFSSLIRDAYVASTIRGMRILTLLSTEMFDGNMAKLFTGTSKKKYLDGPMEQFNSDEYSQQDINKAKSDHHYLWHPHEEDSKLPWNPFSPQTLAIFLSKPGTFPKFIRQTYGIDAQYIKQQYPSDKFASENLDEAKQFSKPVTDMDAENREGPYLPGLEYITIFLKTLLQSLVVGKTSESDLYDVIQKSDTRLTAAAPSREVRIGGEISDNPDEVLERELAKRGNVDYTGSPSVGGDNLKAGLFSEFGNEDRHVVTVLCHEALNTLCEEPGFADKFDFHVLTSGSGNIGDIVEKNLYYEYFDRFFEHYSHSESGATLIYQLYNSLGKDNIQYSVEELRSLKDQLPKNNNSISIQANSSTDLITKINRSVSNTEAIQVAIETTNKVLSDVAGYYLVSGDGSFNKSLVQPLISVLNPQVCTITVDTLKTMKTLWEVTKVSNRSEDKSKVTSTEDLPIEEARGVSNKPKLTKTQAFDIYLDTIKAVFDNLDPEVGIDKAGRTDRNAFIFLYPTETNTANEKASSIFPTREAFRDTYHKLLEKLSGVRDELASAEDTSTIGQIIESALSSTFGSDNLIWKLKPKGYKTILGSMLYPNIYTDNTNTQLRAVNELSVSRLGSNITNVFIQNTLMAGLAELPTATKDRTKPVSGSYDRNATVNTALGAIAVLHSRMEFLIAVKSLSDEIYDILLQYRPTVEQLPAEERRLLSNYDYVRSPRVKRLLKLLVSNVSHVLKRDNDTGEELLDKEDQIHPDYQKFLDDRRARYAARKALRDRINTLKTTVFNDEDI